MKTYLNRSIDLGTGIVKRHIIEKGGVTTVTLKKQKVVVYCPGKHDDPKAVWGVK